MCFSVEETFHCILTNVVLYSWNFSENNYFKVPKLYLLDNQFKKPILAFSTLTYFLL